jgi:hypothetical protein
MDLRGMECFTIVPSSLPENRKVVSLVITMEAIAEVSAGV